MSLFSALVKTGIAKKVFDEARKPENQRKAKEMAQRVAATIQDKRKGGGPAPR